MSTAKRAKLKTEVELARRKVQHLKQEFGVEVWPFIDQPAQVKEIYAVYENKVGKILDSISEKLAEMESLKNDQEPSVYMSQHDERHETIGPSFEDL